MHRYFIIIFLVFFFNSSSYAKEGIEKALDTSSKAIIVQQARMQIIAENIANINTTKTANGKPYRRKDVIIKETTESVKIAGVYEDKEPFLKVYDPGHPDADKQGFVYYPNISISREMTDMAYTSKVYDANIAVYNAAKNMAQAIINLGK